MSDLNVSPSPVYQGVQDISSQRGFDTRSSVINLVRLIIHLLGKVFNCNDIVDELQLSVGVRTLTSAAVWANLYPKNLCKPLCKCLRRGSDLLIHQTHRGSLCRRTV